MFKAPTVPLTTTREYKKPKTKTNQKTLPYKHLPTGNTRKQGQHKWFSNAKYYGHLHHILA